ncbi:MAG: TVP38/TMEM64 family protein [Deltaproteobacteria bacterium]|nr:TVP38/TMEM64 family protein [Deltaproteobacteria bacterium]
MPETPELIVESPPKKASFTRPLILLLALIGMFFAARALHLQDYLQEDRLRGFIASYGMWGPIIYLLIWAVAPVLLFPGLVITVAGGVLFGPVLGVIYTTVGATIGASLAFLVARYLARDWVASKIWGTRLAHLDEKVARQGWKIVLLARVLGVPYILLNYALGVTRIPLLPYALATCIGMLPWTIALVLVSSNLLGLLQGKVSIWLIIGVVLVALVALLPLAVKKIKARRGESVDI